MATNWQIETFTIDSTSIAAILGDPPGTSVPYVAGNTITHWLARLTAARWREKMRQLVRERANLYAIFDAIAQYYNALNLPWYQHPSARALYRAFLAGPPQLGNAGTPYTAEYGDGLNYNGAWYRANARLPIGRDRRPAATQDGSAPFLGAIPSAGADVFTAWHAQNFGRFYDGDLEFCQRFGLRLTTPIGMAPPSYDAHGNMVGARGNRIEYDLNVLNQAVSSVAIERNAWLSPGACWLDGTPCGFDFTALDAYGRPDPRLARTDLFQHNVFAPSEEAYRPWAEQWVQLILNTGIDATIVQSRMYTMYVNNQQVVASPSGLNGFLTAATGVDAAIFLAQRTPDRNVLAVGAGIAAVGAGLATTVVGIPAALIAGAASLAITVGESLRIHSIEGFYRDDLGRFKPTLERGWLGGTPIEIPSPLPANWPPLDQAPKFTVPEAAGVLTFYERRGAAMTTLAPGLADVRFVARTESGGNDTITPQPRTNEIQSSSSLRRLPTSVKIALGAGLAYTLYKLATRSRS